MTEMEKRGDYEAYMSRIRRLLFIPMGRHFSKRVYRALFGNP